MAAMGNRIPHIIFLVETSADMRSYGADRQFSDEHGVILDDIADNIPGAIVSLLTFDTVPRIQYAALPADTASTLDIVASGGSNCYMAVSEGLVPFVLNRPSNEDILAVVFTLGKMPPHYYGQGSKSEVSAGHAQYANAARGLEMLDKRGVRLLFLVFPTERGWADVESLLPYYLKDRGAIRSADIGYEFSDIILAAAPGFVGEMGEDGKRTGFDPISPTGGTR